MGKLYVVEGPDGSGKSSTKKELSERLGAVHVGFPDDFWKRPKGAHPQEFYRQRTLESADFLSEALEKGDVVTARYAYSLSAFAFAYSKGKQRMPLPEGILEPDVIIYVTASPDEIDKRIEQRKESGQSLPRHELDRKLREYMSQRYDELFEGDPRVVKVDTTGRDVSDVVDEILSKI